MIQIIAAEVLRKQSRNKMQVAPASRTNCRLLAGLGMADKTVMQQATHSRLAKVPQFHLTFFS